LLKVVERPPSEEAARLIEQSTTGTNSRRLRLVIAGGGTGGHISPAVAVVQALLRRGVVVEPLWIGSRNGFEAEAAAEHGIRFVAIRTGKLRRYFSLSTVLDIWRVPAGTFQARALLRQFRPDAILSTGGFVSVPTVAAGRLLGIPSLTHEQTATIGLATRINARLCDVVALSYHGTERPRTRRGARVVVTGNPVRPALFEGDPDEAQRLLPLAFDKPLVYVTGGAQGARALNQIVAQALPPLLEQVEILHQCGPNNGNGDFERLTALHARLPAEQRRRYLPVERVGDELAHVYAATRLVVGRSGAGTVAELAALGVPAIFVPLPGAAEQRRNAEVLVAAGAACMIPQDDLTPARLADEICGLVSDPDRLSAMRSSADRMQAGEPADLLVEELLQLAVAPRRRRGATRLPGRAMQA
jgi:UDP-N-acetylglucosamine--N-acetylmuramyl-(pentapeptide) pyrophosphoryl-undecaprenol N-acetylglucosamine transferase